MAELTKRQENFLEHLLLTGNVTQASRLAGISRNTGYTYLKKEVFRRVYRVRRAEQLKETTTLLQHASIKAVKILEDIMLDETVSPYARQQAAQSILNTVYKAVDTVEVLEMVEDLETKIEGGQ